MSKVIKDMVGNEMFALELKDMYAIKHSLQATIRYKKNKLQEEADPFNRDRLIKDIAREEILLNKFMISIQSFKQKNNIQ